MDNKGMQYHPQPPQPPPYGVGYSQAHSAIYVQPTMYSVPVQMVVMPPHTAHIPDFMCWSIANIFFGGIILGLISLALSSTTRSYKRSGDAGSAKGWAIATGPNR
ncbi:unnamed protein product [Didymodactylos carnosus]|uniref:Uncharacterized protein n=1 Tax=Didymodactylos carnosus TaxID=1234261 RepID=A0A814F9E8_9BILA|nr:unnamed protein product [Didymodactylos carnosus]CAF3752529.1 unnamed protein product [Didymodactylos carnosus]